MDRAGRPAGQGPGQGRAGHVLSNVYCPNGPSGCSKEPRRSSPGPFEGTRETPAGQGMCMAEGEWKPFELFGDQSSFVCCGHALPCLV